MAMDVPGQHGSDISWQVGSPDHLLASAEDEIPGPAGRPLDALVHAEDSQIGGRLVAPGGIEHLAEAGAHVAHVGEPGKGDSQPTNRKLDRAWRMKDVQVRVRRQQREGEARPLVVSRHEQYRNAPGGHSAERRERGLGQPSGYATPVEEVASVNHDVDLAVERRREREVEVPEEVLPPPPPNDPGVGRKVQAEVGIR
jgi:hypothetical protein